MYYGLKYAEGEENYKNLVQMAKRIPGFEYLETNEIHEWLEARDAEIEFTD